MLPKSHLKARVPLRDDDPLVGPLDAPITLVVFGDLTHSLTTTFLPTLKRIRAAVGPARVRFTFKHAFVTASGFTLPAAEAASGVGELVGASAFFAFSDRITSHWDARIVSNLGKWAEEVGADGELVARGVRSRRWEDKVQADRKLASVLDVLVAPTTFVNGRRVEGNMWKAPLQKIVEDELVATRRMREAGVPALDIYPRRVVENWRPRPPGESEEARTFGVAAVAPTILGSAADDAPW